jgi:hypothetical protein
MQIYALAKPIIIPAYCCMTFIKYKQYPGKLGLEHSPVGLWNFEGNLNDSSGNDFHLSGTPRRYLTNEKDFFEGVVIGAELTRPSRDAALAITGALTIEVVGRFFNLSTDCFICSIGNSLETTADNVNYSVYVTSTSQLTILWEYGSGSNVFVTSDSNAIPIGIPCFIAITRSSDDPAQVAFFVNGESVGVGSTTATSGGTASTCRFRVASSNSSGSIFYGAAFSSLKIIPSQLSQDQIKQEYNKSLGNSTYFFPMK